MVRPLLMDPVPKTSNKCSFPFSFMLHLCSILRNGMISCGSLLLMNILNTKKFEI